MAFAEREAAAGFDKGRYWEALLNYVAAFKNYDAVHAKNRTPMLKCALLTQSLTTDHDVSWQSVLSPSHCQASVSKTLSLLAILHERPFVDFANALEAAEFADVWEDLGEFRTKFIAYWRRKQM